METHELIVKIVCRIVAIGCDLWFPRSSGLGSETILMGSRNPDQQKSLTMPPCVSRPCD